MPEKIIFYFLKVGDLNDRKECEYPEEKMDFKKALNLA